MYSYTAVQGYQSTHEQTSSTTRASRHCDEETLVSTAGTIEPFHLNPFLQDSPRTAFEDSRRTFQLLNAGQYYVDSDPIQNSAYQLDEGFHALEQPRFSSTSTFEAMQHGLYQAPYSDSVTPPSGSPSPTAARSRIHGNTLEGSSRGEDATVGREDIEEDDAGSDKPYARLIWEALMQAPGHRMMLREIYAWFQCNTNKARESGSNGWQNSIRHNLSMNQVRTFSLLMLDSLQVGANHLFRHSRTTSQIRQPHVDRPKRRIVSGC
jgi:Forkhead domain